jgi:hypothetical protein
MRVNLRTKEKNEKQWLVGRHLSLSLGFCLRGEIYDGKCFRYTRYRFNTLE